MFPNTSMHKQYFCIVCDVRWYRTPSGAYSLVNPKSQPCTVCTNVALRVGVLRLVP